MTENRILRNQIKGRMHLSDGERRTLAELGKKLGKKALEEVATIVKPDTILAWYHTLVAQKFDGSQQRKTLGPEFAVYRHLWTQKPCICGVHPLKRPEIHRYMNRSIFLDITAIGSYMRRHVLTNNPTATQARSRRGLLPACRELLP